MEVPAYNIRIVNALLEGYHKEVMLDKSESFKRRVKRKGAGLNAKTWEILMEYYLRNGDMKSVHRSFDRGIKKGRSHDRIWLLPDEVIWSLIMYFEDEKDVKGADGFIELVKGVNKDLGAEVFESLIRTYVAAGKKSLGMSRRLKMGNVAVNDIVKWLLPEICDECVD